ncbi:MAG: hypothetical protein ACOVOQ_07425 [Flavobacterium sp.]
MKLLFKTTNPTKLKADILKLAESDKLKTWTKVEYEYKKYIKHTPQWGEKGFVILEVDTTKGQLIVYIQKFQNVTQEVKDFEGYYLGRFCELIFVNFANEFSEIIKG